MLDPTEHKVLPCNARSNRNSDSEHEHATSAESSEHYALITQIRKWFYCVYFLCRCHRVLQLP